jgi:hypothetical protein
MPSPDRDPAGWLPLTPALLHVLLSLADGPKHGYAILKEVAERTGGRVELSTGTLYGIIKRLLADGRPDCGVGGRQRRPAARLSADAVRPQGRRRGNRAPRRDCRHGAAQAAPAGPA